MTVCEDQSFCYTCFTGRLADGNEPTLCGPMHQETVPQPQHCGRWSLTEVAKTRSQFRRERQATRRATTGSYVPWTFLLHCNCARFGVGGRACKGPWSLRPVKNRRGCEWRGGRPTDEAAHSLRRQTPGCMHRKDTA
jgi:hypothetical protein